MRKNQRSWILILIALFMSGCTGLRLRDRSEIAKTKGSLKSEPNSALAMPSNIAKSNSRVALILGPGGFKSVAEVGVLKELLKSKIPINAVVGVEWGALVGALYAQHGQINEAQWDLYKLDQLNLGSAGFFSRRRKTQSVAIINRFLKQNLANVDVTKTSVPFACPTLRLSQGTVELHTQGNLSQVVKDCLALPPVFKPTGDLMAGALSLSDIATQLHTEGYNVIILVNVLNDGNLFAHSRTEIDDSTIALWDEIRRQVWKTQPLVTDVINVNTQGISMDDFKARMQLITAGETAGNQAAATISSKYGF